MNVPFQFWWPNYIKSLFVISNTFRPGIDFTVKESSDAMTCFIISITKLLPDQGEINKRFTNFIMMTKEVSSTLLTNLPRFFSVFPNYKKVIQENGSHFLYLASQSNESMFIWVYLFQAYIFITMNNYSQIPSLNQMKELYNISTMKKYDWGNPLWFVIHMSALYAPQPIQESFENYKSLLRCLQYFLPCPKCIDHLQLNLTKINIDKCAKTNYELFKCSVDLHNIVNVSKIDPARVWDYEEAIKKYTPSSNNM